VALAQPVVGPYVSLLGGTSFLSPVTATDVFGSGKVQTRPSYEGDGAVGYGFGNGLRLELSGNYDRNTVHKAGGSRATGGVETYGPIVNVLYDIDAGLPVFPYVGAGVGYQWQKLDSTFRAPGVTASGNKGSVDYNLIAGLSYPIAAVPGLSAVAEYKFTQQVEKRTYDGVKVDSEQSHAVLAGLRYALFTAPAAAPVAAAPAPAPAPVAAAPAPAPARTYLVFFDWDKSDLTAKATQIIADAASAAKSGSTTALDVSGYTDTSGTVTYNQGLSVRRAKAVAAELVADGVSASEIEVQAFGETHLLVPTGPGVREPQNRRVSIVLQ
jgi:outer membrane protein OmpA-like peptidoglycan-associated protein